MFEWSNRGTDGAAERFAEASHRVADAMRDARDAVARGAGVGSDYAKAVSGEVVSGARRATRSARAAVDEHPVEALLAVGLAAFALGWLLRRVQEMAHERRGTSAAAAARARSRSSRRGRTTRAARE
jgi:hypothetical protein